MSKAFKGEDSSAAPVIRAGPTLAPGEKRYITADGYAKLRGELAQTEEQLRGEKASDVRAALADRARLINATLEVVTVVAAPASPPERVVFGSWVDLEGDDGGQVKYRLVGPDEVDPKSGLVSAVSPVGRALIGKEPGDDVRVMTPSGVREYRVLAIAWPSGIGATTAEASSDGT